MEEDKRTDFILVMRGYFSDEEKDEISNKMRRQHNNVLVIFDKYDSVKVYNRSIWKKIKGKVMEVISLLVVKLKRMKKR